MSTKMRSVDVIDVHRNASCAKYKTGVPDCQAGIPSWSMRGKCVTLRFELIGASPNALSILMARFRLRGRLGNSIAPKAVKIVHDEDNAGVSHTMA